MEGGSAERGREGDRESGEAVRPKTTVPDRAMDGIMRRMIEVGLEAAKRRHECRRGTLKRAPRGGAGTISTVSVPRAITAGVSDNVVKIRFRGSAVTTNGTFEVWLVTGSAEDGEFVCDIALTADASASGATMGGYYFGNVNDTNDAQTVTYVRKSNCDTNHRMGVFSFDVKTGWYVVIVPKTVTNGIVYWDYCGY